MESKGNKSYALRTVGLIGSLALLLSLIIIAFCSALGIVGSRLVDSGCVSVQSLYDLKTVITVILFAGIALALILSFLANRTLVRPIRHMTAAMGELARGNFDVRVGQDAGGWLRETREFGESFDVAAEELGSTEIMRANFISDFSHEFRTPITTLSGFAQLLREGGLTEEEQAEYLDIIVEESNRLAGLSERILALSKIEVIAVLPEVQQVEVNAQLQRAAKMAEARAGARNVAVEVSGEPCSVVGNADYLMQLWTNLIDNAVKFSPDGGTVCVALRAERRRATARLRGEDVAVVEVSDEGPGIAAEAKERIFEKFYQADSSRASEGNGLGLALCKRIAELHGGTIEADNGTNGGAVFKVRIPLHDNT